MRNLSSSDLLELWELGHGLHPLDRGLLVLEAALPGTTYESLADWPLGRRNAALAAVRCACFGTRLEGWAACSGCGEKLEFDVDGRMLAEGAPLDASGRSGLAVDQVMVGEHAFRLPTSRDLAGVLREMNLGRAVAGLLESCRLGGEGALDLTESERDMVGESMARADPMAEIRLEVVCPVCGHEGEATLDVLAFFWAEAEVRVKRLLLEIHHLASAYGWSEGQILELSEHRRALYLDMVQA